MQPLCRAVVLAPHPDDAAFSIGGTLQKGIFRATTIITVFGKTNYLGNLGFQSDWHAASAIRRREDTDFAMSIGAKSIFRDYPEAALRLGATDDAIFAKDSNAPLQADPALICDLENEIRHEAATVILAPLGLGGHADHLIVQRSAVEMQRTTGIPVIYYEDLPYAAGLQDSEIESRVHAVCPGFEATVIRLGRHLDAKMKALLIYRTQISDEIISPIRHYAHRIDSEGAERLWCPPGFDLEQT